MNLDWNKIGESAALLIPAALVSGYLGARLKAFVDRGRPRVSILSCRTADQADLYGHVVELTEDLSHALRDFQWANLNTQRANAARVLTEVKSIRRAIAEARRTLAFIATQLADLPRIKEISTQEQVRFLGNLWQEKYSLIDASVTAGLVRKELRVSLPSDEEVDSMNVVVPYLELEDQVGYALDFGYKYYNFYYKKQKRYQSAMLPAVKAISRCYVPGITDILEYAKHEITQLIVQGDQLATRVQQAADDVAPLVVEVSVVNRGRSSVVFSPWGLIRLLDDTGQSHVDVELATVEPLWQPDDPTEIANYTSKLLDIARIPETRQQPFVVDAGRTVRVVYQSRESIGSIETRFPKLQSVLATDLFRCAVYLKRADVEALRQRWVKSSVGIFGGQAQNFPSAEVSILK